MIIKNLEMYTPRQLEEKLLKLCYDTNLAEQKKIETENEYLCLKGIKEEKLASLVMKVEGKSQTEKERMVFVSEPWGKYKDDLMTAEINFNLSNLEFKMKAREWETCRSIMSSRNSERRSGV